MNESPRSVKDLILQNEALAEDNDTLYKTNEQLILEIRELKDQLDQQQHNVELNNSELYKIDEKYYSLEELRAFITNCDKLARKTERQNRFIKALKINNSQLSVERNQLQNELDHIKSMSMFEFGNKYASDESLEADGRAFAKSLLGKPMTKTDIEEETFIAEGEAEYERTWNIADGDDF